jgi:N-acetyldiaminopimelate deacetylase
MSINPIDFRKHLHCHPEASLKEFQTTQFIKESLADILAAESSLSLHFPLETGLVLEWTHKPLAPYIVLRADIDALPAPVGSAKAFAGFMHACGHDVHSAILYGLIREIFQEKIQLDYNILFVFQPAEEDGGGALQLLQNGFFKKYNIEAAYALHVSDDYEIGQIASNPDTLFASALGFDLSFHGKASHLAFPEKGHNAFKALRLFLNEVEELEKAGAFEDVLWGFGRVEAGHVRNILPDKALICGSIRASSSAQAIAFFNFLKTQSALMADKTHTIALLSEVSFYPAVKNNPDLFSKLKKNRPDLIECPMKFTGEDFGCFTEIYPSLMVWLGTRKAGEEAVGLHHEDFCPSDEVIEKGIEVLKSFILRGESELK